MKEEGVASDLRAVLFATPRAASDLPVPADHPTALLPLGHATLVERLLEQLVLSGASEIDIVACDRPELLRDALGDGGRWGVCLRWHLAKDPERPYAMLRSARLPQSRRVVIGHTDRWIAPDAIRRLAGDDHSLLQLDGADALAWTGWASMPGAMLRPAFPSCDQRALGAELARRGLRPAVLRGSNPAPALDARGLLLAQREVIAGSAEAPLPAQWIAMPWGAASPRARIHPGANIVGPVLIGPGCLVAAGATVGPGTILSSDVIVGADTRVHEAVVLPGTYFGKGLEVNDAIVNGGRVRHVALGVETQLPRSDGLMLSLEARPGRGPSLGGRLFAAIAATVLLPGLALAAFRKRRDEPLLPWGVQQVVVGLDTATRTVAVAPLRSPRASASGLRRALAHYGGLLDVVQGRRCWFGVRPRRSGEWYALSPEWQSLLAGAPIGLLNAPAWAADDGVRMEAGAAADAFYVARRNWRENIRVACAAVRPGGCGWRPRRRTPPLSRRRSELTDPTVQ
jgi:hypothetical protein